MATSARTIDEFPFEPIAKDLREGTCMSSGPALPRSPRTSPQSRQAPVPSRENSQKHGCTLNFGSSVTLRVPTILQRRRGACVPDLTART